MHLLQKGRFSSSFLAGGLRAQEQSLFANEVLRAASNAFLEIRRPQKQVLPTCYPVWDKWGPGVAGEQLLPIQFRRYILCDQQLSRWHHSVTEHGL